MAVVVKEKEPGKIRCRLLVVVDPIFTSYKKFFMIIVNVKSIFSVIVIVFIDEHG